MHRQGGGGFVLLTGEIGTGKTTVAVDEMYAFIAHPRFGQVRFGDEDGVMGALMNSGWVQGFGTGGVHGSWESFVTRAGSGRTTTAPGGLGDLEPDILQHPAGHLADHPAVIDHKTGLHVGMLLPRAPM